MWKQHHYMNGFCFGMSYTTASMINGFPECESIRKLINVSSGLASFSSAFKIAEKYISVRDYITYAQIYQFSSESQSNSVWTDIKTIYDLVEAFVSNNKIAVTIGMTRTDGSGGHRVLAVGIDGNDILIDDPNNSKDLERITVNSDGTWSFSGLTGWNSDTCRIRYSKDFYVPYSLLLTGKTVSVKNDGNDNKSTVNGMDILDKNNLLLTVNNPDCIIENQNLIEIFVDCYDEADLQQTKQYWVKDDKTVKISNNSGNSNEFRLAGENMILQTKVSDVSSLSMTVSEADSNICINSIEGNAYELSFIMFDEDGFEPKELYITGTASGDTVTACETQSGVVVNGLNNIAVTYSQNETELSKTKALVDDGRDVNITVDNSNNKVKTDFVNENAANVCEYCGKVHGDSYFEKLIELIHIILHFLEAFFN